MNRRATGVSHSCEDRYGRLVDRHYPEFHWLGMGQDDPKDHPFADWRHPLHYKVLMCEACGRAYTLPREFSPKDVSEMMSNPEAVSVSHE